MAAKLITAKSLASEAADRWHEVYGASGSCYGSDKPEITAKLRELGANPKPADVNRAIGNDSWTRVPDCDSCGKVSPKAVVRVGQEPEYDSATVHLCKKCVAAAAALFNPGA